MGCCLSYFRISAKQKSSPISSAETTPSKSEDRVVFRSHILTLFAHEGISSPANVRKELQQEAKFLKACGALLKSPAEFIGPSKNTRDQSSSSSQSLGSSCETLQMFDIPAFGCEEDHLSENQHDSNIMRQSNDQNTDMSLPAKTKSVRFEMVEEEGNQNESGPVSISIHTPQKSTHIHPSASIYSPGSTPLNLTEEMETPSTVYPANNTQVQSQFIHPVSKRINEVYPLPGQSEHGLPLPMHIPLGNNESFSVGNETVRIEGKAEGDKAIIWDGKGIPNSTKKYKEDQRVRWHSTPFEKRIEKALSEEKVHPQSKLIDGRK